MILLKRYLHAHDIAEPSISSQSYSQMGFDFFGLAPMLGFTGRGPKWVIRQDH